ncbi:hypothetical protein PR001_g1552 [Phytophthora rubi]|uniref:Uncharacterized protein n=1 Tax=Phytophthora rubi TaxID=129364 RepID=A0A6A3P8J2_9STRA|nr:hypothetical protein PR001_g1552 [Phytophthora rubi]
MVRTVPLGLTTVLGRTLLAIRCLRRRLAKRRVSDSKRWVTDPPWGDRTRCLTIWELSQRTRQWHSASHSANTDLGARGSQGRKAPTLVAGCAVLRRRRARKGEREGARWDPRASGDGQGRMTRRLGDWVCVMKVREDKKGCRQGFRR